MNDELDMQQLTDALRAVGAPPEPPPGYEQIARDAALGTAAPAEVVRIDHHRLRRRLARPALALVVIAASTIAALVIGVGGNQTPITHTVNMSAASGANASVDFLEADGAVRPVVVKISNLPPAGDGHYYQLWMSENGENMPVAAFNTDSDGSVTAKSTMPADMGWDRCWITLDSTADRSGTDDPVVLQS
jgi:hypothetical protein